MGGDQSTLYSAGESRAAPRAVADYPVGTFLGPPSSGPHQLHSSAGSSSLDEDMMAGQHSVPSACDGVECCLPLPFSTLLPYRKGVEHTENTRFI